MKTKQEQIEKLAQLIGRIKDDCENCDCKSCEVNGEDCCCVHYICSTFLVDAGYGDVSEYKSEIKRLKAEFKQLETNAEILARGVRDLNHENYELTQKLAKQTRIARDANAKCTGAEIYLRPFQYKADRLETKCNDLKRLSDWQREEIKILKAEVNKGCDNCETIKQAKIDVLNKAKEKFNAISRVLADDSDIGADIDGIFAVSSCIRKIDEIIKEVQNEN